MGQAHDSEAFSSSSMMIMFLLQYCFSSLWCGCWSLGFEQAWIARHSAALGTHGHGTHGIRVAKSSYFSFAVLFVFVHRDVLCLCSIFDILAFQPCAGCFWVQRVL